MMSESELFLTAFFENLENHGVGQVPIRIIMDKIEDAFHKHDVYNDLDADGKKIYHSNQNKV